MIIKLAIQKMGGEDWTAGDLYTKTISDLLRSDHKEVDLNIFNIFKEEGKRRRDFDEDNIAYVTYPVRWSPRWIIYYAARNLFHKDRIYERVLQENGINVLFSPLVQYRFKNIATLSWFPDFQHIHLAEMFDKKSLAYRNRTFMKSAEVSDRIILISESVRKDFERFAPQYIEKVRVVRPIVDIPTSIYSRDLHEILGIYDLPEKFIYLPNQFWKHKNHRLVVRAVRRLKDIGEEIFVVCSGNMYDYRFPKYFNELLDEISLLDVNENIIIMGFIPYEHVLLLIRQCICLLNPSLFEGWGITVSEAYSVGKRVLLSDIAAHREQNPPKAMFFDPTDPEELADKLHIIWNNTEAGPDYKLEQQAREERPGRIGSFIESFISVTKEAYEGIHAVNRDIWESFRMSNAKQRLEGGRRISGDSHISNAPRKPVVSVITVCLNSEKYLEETIKSVINQTYKNIEYIIVDGGSTDGTLGIIKKYEDIIDYWLSEADRGIYDAMNKGVDLSRGELIGIINSDDRYMPNAVEEVVRTHVNNREAAVFYGDLIVMDQSGKPLGIKNGSLERIYINNTLNHPTCFINRGAFIDNKFRTDLEIAADYELMLRLYFSGAVFHYIPKPLAYFRSGGKSSNYYLTYSELYYLRKEYGLITTYGYKSLMVLLPLKVLSIKLKEYIVRTIFHSNPNNIIISMYRRLKQRVKIVLQ